MIAIASKIRHHSLLLFVGVMLLTGCSTLAKISDHRIDLCRAKMSFLRLNTKGNRPCVKNRKLDQSLNLLTMPADHLDRMIESGRGPEAEQMNGAWLGINKGVAAAATGWMQDIKYFQTCGQSSSGFNIPVHQVPIGDLECNGWQPKQKCLSDEPKTLGNFIVVPNRCDCSPLRLDYTQAENPWYDPAQMLLDDLVEIEPNLVLGRASICVGGKLRTLAYFVLLRMDSECDAADAVLKIPACAQACASE